MKFIWNHCKYILIAICIILVVTWLLLLFTDVPIELWEIATVFIGFGAAKLDNRRNI